MIDIVQCHTITLTGLCIISQIERCCGVYIYQTHCTALVMD